MENRNVEFSNRYRLVKVAGTEDLYDLLPVPGNVYAEGTPFVKATMLADDTAKSLGLPTTAVPNDAFRAQADFTRNVGSQHVWEQRETYMEDAPVPESTSTTIGLSYGVSGSEITSGVTVYRRAEIQNGKVVLVGQVEVSSRSAEGYCALISGVPYLLGPNVDSSVSGVANYTAYKLSPGKVSRERPAAYPTSSDSSAYPPAVSDGFSYIPLGMLGNASGVEIVSRIGTGGAGANNPCEITFSRPPKVVMYLGARENQTANADAKVSAYDRRLWQIMDLVPLEYAAEFGLCTDMYTTLRGKKSADGKTLSWYLNSSSSSATSDQLNSEGVEYFFMGIF